MMTAVSNSLQKTETSPKKSVVLNKDLKPFNTGDIKILLLEGVNQTGVKILTNAGYQVI